MSDFWVKKMKTYFTRIDFDHDGAITKADFEGMAARFIETAKFTGDKAADVNKTLLAIWSDISSHSGGAEKISQDAFIEAAKKAVGNPEQFKAPLPHFFHAVDLDNDGSISGDEYKEFFRILGLDVALAEASFKAIDTDNDGKLSLDEFSKAGVDFFTSDDANNPNSLFWGPLV